MYVLTFLAPKMQNHSMQQIELLLDPGFCNVAYEKTFHYCKLVRNNDVTSPRKSVSVRKSNMQMSYGLCWRYLIDLAYSK